MEMIDDLGVKNVLLEDDLAALLGGPQRDDSRISVEDTLRLFDQLKLLHRAVINDKNRDVVEAYVASGGNADRSGHVDAQLLRDRVNQFALSADIDRLLEEIDEDGSGTVEYDEFSSLLLSLKNDVGAVVEPSTAFETLGGDPEDPNSKILLGEIDNRLEAFCPADDLIYIWRSVIDQWREKCDAVNYADFCEMAMSVDMRKADDQLSSAAGSPVSPTSPGSPRALRGRSPDQPILSPCAARKRKGPNTRPVLSEGAILGDRIRRIWARFRKAHPESEAAIGADEGEPGINDDGEFQCTIPKGIRHLLTLDESRLTFEMNLRADVFENPAIRRRYPPTALRFWRVVATACKLLERHRTCEFCAWQQQELLSAARRRRQEAWERQRIGKPEDPAKATFPPFTELATPEQLARHRKAAVQAQRSKSKSSFPKPGVDHPPKPLVPTKPRLLSYDHTNRRVEFLHRQLAGKKSM